MAASSDEVADAEPSEPPDVREARRIVNEYDCVIYGHSWDVIATPVRPLRLVCGRCGKAYHIAEELDAKNPPPPANG